MSITPRRCLPTRLANAALGEFHQELVVFTETIFSHLFADLEKLSFAS
jgi:hypothetical protein